MTSAQAANRLKVGETQVERLCRQKQLRGRKVWRTVKHVHRGTTVRRRMKIWEISVGTVNRLLAKRRRARAQ